VRERINTLDTRTLAKLHKSYALLGAVGRQAGVRLTSPIPGAPRRAAPPAGSPPAGSPPAPPRPRTTQPPPLLNTPPADELGAILDLSPAEPPAPKPAPMPAAPVAAPRVVRPVITQPTTRPVPAMSSADDAAVAMEAAAVAVLAGGPDAGSNGAALSATNGAHRAPAPVKPRAGPAARCRWLGGPA
jgi:hypothetical protein